MRNRHAAKCEKCGLIVDPGQGVLRKVEGKWRVDHASSCPRPVERSTGEGFSWTLADNGDCYYLGVD